MECKICKRNTDLRFGVCFDCAEAESIINEGTDMYDKGDAKTPMDKLKMLISKGWGTSSYHRERRNKN